jgi:hypothetical protein
MYAGRMPFGKHKGRLIADVPTGYLQWMLDTIHDLRPSLRYEVEQELRRRDFDPPPEREANDPSPPVQWSAIISTWYRGLARDYHPDRGGTVEAMQAINEAHERLKKLAGVGE